MPGGWGSAKNKIRIGVFWDGIEYNADKSQARITDPRIAIDRGVNIDDSSNSLSWSGGAVNDGSDSNINVDGSGQKRIKNVTGQWQTLSYTSETTVSFSAEFAGVNYAGGTLYASKSVTFPKRAVSKPAGATSLVLSGSGDTRTLTWDYTSTTAAPVAKSVIQLSTNDGAFTTIANVAAPTKTVTVPNLPDNGKFKLRVATNNAAGDTTSPADSEVFYTKPSAPTTCSAAKQADGSIAVTFNDPANYNTSFQVQDSADGTTWTTVGTPGDLPDNPQVWVHAAPSTAVTHRYRVAAVGADGQVSAWSPVSNIVQLLAPPNAPTNLQPAGVARDPSQDITFSWALSHPDSSPQTSYTIRHRVGGGAWTTLAATASSTPARTFAGGTFGAGVLEWQVATKGLHATYGPFSGSAFVTLADRPTVTILLPDGELLSSLLVAQLGYADSGGNAQASATVRLYNDGGTEPIRQRTAAGPVTEFDFSGQPLPEGVYRLEAVVTNSLGLSSDMVSETFEVSYLPPAVPEVVETAWNAEAGSLSIATSNAPGAGVTEVRRNLVNNPQGTVPTASGWNLTPRWGGKDATVSTTTVNTPVTLPDGTQVDSFRRKTYTVAPTAAALDIAWQFMVSSTNRAPVTAGKTYTLQYAWRKSFLGTQTFNRFEVRFYTDVSSGTEVGTTVVGPTLNNPAANTWQRDSFTFTVPATATHCVIYHYYAISDFGVITVGSTFDATAVMVEESPVQRPYFDGAHSPDPGLTPAWVGSANASESVLQTRATVDTVSQSLYRVDPDGTRELVTNLGVNDTALDATPITTGQGYVLVGWTAEGAYAETSFFVEPDPALAGWFYISKTGAAVRLRAAMQRKRAASLAVQVENYAGRDTAVSTYGQAVTETTSLSGVMLPTDDTDWLQLRQVVLTTGDAVVRSPDGLRFRAALTGTEADDNDLTHQKVTLAVTHVGD